MNIAPLSGEWRFSNDIICCGTLKIAVLDIDTLPSDEFKTKLGAWMCRVLNEAQSKAQLSGTGPVALKAQTLDAGLVSLSSRAKLTDTNP